MRVTAFRGTALWLPCASPILFMALNRWRAMSPPQWVPGALLRTRAWRVSLAGDPSRPSAPCLLNMYPAHHAYGRMGARRWLAFDRLVHWILFRASNKRAYSTISPRSINEPLSP